MKRQNASFGTELNQAYLHDDEFKELHKSKRTASTDIEYADAIVSNPVENAKWKLEHLPHDHFFIVRGFLSYLFDPETNEFHRASDTIRDRSHFEAVLINGKVVAVSTFSMIAAGTVEYFNKNSNKWVHATPLPRTLRSIGATAKDGTLFVTGGIDLHSMERSKSILQGIFSDQGELEWRELPAKLNVPRYRHGATTAPDGKVWVAGGIILSGSPNGDPTTEAFTSSTEIFDPSTGLCTAGPPMCTCRAIDVSLVQVGDSLYAVGGDVATPAYDATGLPEPGSIEKLNKEKGVWEKVAKFPIERHGVSACVYGGVIYIFGGHRVKIGQHLDDYVTTWDGWDTVRGEWLSHDGKERVMPFDCMYGSACTLPAGL